MTDLFRNNQFVLARLSFDSDVRPMIPWLITGVSLAYVCYIQHKLKRQGKGSPKEPINAFIDKQKQRVRHVFKGEELEKGKKLSLCRCWRSETFPLCDGAHKQYNKEYNDNVGPVCIEWSDDYEDLESKTIVEPDIQSMNASTELSSLEMIDSNGENTSPASSQSADENNQF